MSVQTQAATPRPNTGRGYDTSFEAQNGLIHKLARKLHSRVLATHVNMPYEDVYQEACLSYVEALRTYDPSRGITFSAYMGRAVLNNVNRIVGKHIEERVQHKVKLFSELSNEDDENYTPEEIFASSVAGVEETAIRSVEIRERINSLTPNARRIIRELMSPTPQVINAHKAYIEHCAAQYAKSGRQQRTHAKLTVRLIGRYLGLTPRQMTAITREYKTVLGVSIHA